MFRRIVAFVCAPLFMAVAKKTSARIKRPGKSIRRSGRKDKPVTGARKQLELANKKVVPVRAEAPPQEIAPLPPPPPPVAPVQAPALFSPPAGESADSLTPSFRWFYVGSASHYELVWSLDAHFHKAHILFTNQTAALLPPEQALSPGATYAWRVRGGNEGGWGPWSATRTFTTPAE